MSFQMGKLWKKREKERSSRNDLEKKGWNETSQPVAGMQRSQVAAASAQQFFWP